MISKTKLSKFKRDGYIHIKNFFDENEIKKIKNAVNKKKALIESGLCR